MKGWARFAVRFGEASALPAAIFTEHRRFLLREGEVAERRAHAKRAEWRRRARRFVERCRNVIGCGHADRDGAGRCRWCGDA